jgi:hypothetical protein
MQNITNVIPANAGIQYFWVFRRLWIPASAGMTVISATLHRLQDITILTWTLKAKRPIHLTLSVSCMSLYLSHEGSLRGLNHVRKGIILMPPGLTLTLQKSRVPQILGVEGEAVVLYREPSTTQEMGYPRLSRRANKMAVFPVFRTSPVVDSSKT